MNNSNTGTRRAALRRPGKEPRRREGRGDRRPPVRVIPGGPPRRPGSGPWRVWNYPTISRDGASSSNNNTDTGPSPGPGPRGYAS